MITAKEAIEFLDDMQKQIHGNRNFGDIADVIRSLIKSDEECQKILGYNSGDLIHNVTRYKNYATREIKCLRAGGERLADYTRKLQGLVPQEAVIKLGMEAVALKNQMPVFKDKIVTPENL